MCSCHSIPECCVMFSGDKLSMGSFILFGIQFTQVKKKILLFSAIILMKTKLTL